MKFRAAIVLLCCFANFGMAADLPRAISESSISGANELAMQALNEGEINITEPEDILVWVEMPKSVKLNSVASLKIEIRNLRTDKPFKIDSVDLGANIGSGFEVKKVSPSPSNTDTLSGELSLEYQLSVPAGESMEILVELIALKEGVYKGDVDIWEGENFLTRVAQSRVIK